MPAELTHLRRGEGRGRRKNGQASDGAGTGAGALQEDPPHPGSLQVGGGEDSSLFSTFAPERALFSSPADDQLDVLGASNVETVPLLSPMEREQTRGEQGFRLVSCDLDLHYVKSLFDHGQLQGDAPRDLRPKAA